MTMLDLDYKQSVLELKKTKECSSSGAQYQLPEVQDIADFIGDSLALSKQAALAQSDIILFLESTSWQKQLQFYAQIKSSAGP